MAGTFLTKIEVEIKPNLDSNTYTFHLEWDSAGSVDMATIGPLKEALIHMEPWQLERLGKLMTTLGEFWGRKNE